MVKIGDIVRNINILNKKIDKTDNFYKEAREISNERAKDEYRKSKDTNYRAEIEYGLFNCWCRVKELEADGNSFRDYLSESGRKIDFWLKKTIAEKYLGYKYDYDYKEKKWSVIKL